MDLNFLLIKCYFSSLKELINAECMNPRGIVLLAQPVIFRVLISRGQ